MDSRSITEVIMPLISPRNLNNKKTVTPFITKVSLKKRDLLEKMAHPFSLQNEEYLAATSRHLFLSSFPMCILVRLSNFNKMIFFCNHHIAGDKITIYLFRRHRRVKFSKFWTFLGFYCEGICQRIWNNDNHCRFCLDDFIPKTPKI